MVASLAKKQKQTTSLKPAALRGSRWRNFTVIIACQLLALLFVEVVLTASGLGEDEIFRFDRQLGFVHIPNKRVTWRTEGFSQSYFDADGMREPNLTIAKPANTYRVALLGDSMTEGLQVNIDKTFGSIVSKRLSPMDGKQVQVLNFATSGYSTVQEFLQLKRQVLKYKPDLTIVCYNSRDMFENWAAPDQVITNVRPIAIHLPGSYLFVDSSPVARWWGSPRARFLLATSWFREHSHIYGLMTALELDWSQHNPVFRAIMGAIAHPKKARNEFKEAMAPANINKTMAGLVASVFPSSAAPAFHIKSFEESKSSSAAPAIATAAATAPAQSSQHTAIVTANRVFNSAATNEELTPPPVPASLLTKQSADLLQGKSDLSLASTLPASASATKAATPAAAAPAPELPGGNVYRSLVTRTLTSLFGEMKASCEKQGGKFAVMGVPSRAQLCPNAGLERTFNGMDYNEELMLVSGACRTNNISFLNCETLAEQLPIDGRDALYYAVHLTPGGQQFLADCAEPFIQRQLSQQ